MNSITKDKSHKNRLLKACAVTASTVATVLLSSMLTGCIPQYYTAEFESSVKKKSEELIKNYLSANYDDYSLSTVHMASGYRENSTVSSYGSTVGSAEVTIDGYNYIFYADTETEEIYSTKVLYDLGQYYWSELTGRQPGEEDIIAELDTDAFATVIESYSDNSGASLNAGIYDVNVTLDSAFSVSMSMEEVIAENITDMPLRHVYLDIYFCSDDYDSVTTEDIRSFMDTHPEINSLKLYNISRGDMDYFKSNNYPRYIHPLALKEEYIVDNIISDTYTYKYHTHEIIGDTVGVNYVSQVVTMNTDDYEIVELKKYNCPVEADGDKLYTQATNDESPAYLFFLNNSKYTHANVTTDSSSDITVYNIAEFKCGYYSLLGKYEYVTSNRGYLIKDGETILLLP